MGKRIITVFLFLVSLNSFSQSAWDYDSLPKRNPYDVGSNHITDYYSSRYAKKSNKLKSITFEEEKTTITHKFGKNGLLKTTETIRYGRPVVNNRWINRSKTDLITEIEARSYTIEQGYYMVTLKKYTNRKDTDTTYSWYYYSLKTGYLVKYIYDKSISTYTYNDSGRLVNKIVAEKRNQREVDTTEFFLTYTDKQLLRHKIEIKEEYFFIKRTSYRSDTSIVHDSYYYYTSDYKKMYYKCQCSSPRGDVYRKEQKNYLLFKKEKKVYSKLCESGCLDHKFYPIWEITYKKAKARIRKKYY